MKCIKSILFLPTLVCLVALNGAQNTESPNDVLPTDLTSNIKHPLLHNRRADGPLVDEIITNTNSDNLSFKEPIAENNEKNELKKQDLLDLTNTVLPSDATGKTNESKNLEEEIVDFEKRGDEKVLVHSNEEKNTSVESNQERGNADPSVLIAPIKNETSSTTVASEVVIVRSASTSMQSIRLSPSTISWLDIFMLQNRDGVWIAFNTLFIIFWFLLSLFALYRLFDLNLCSPHLSRTQYLVIHTLCFTAGVFEIVQLFHLNYGRHQGLPLFLTLLLTHTPTPLLASCIITMCYCIFCSSRVPILGRYFPPLVYVGVLCSFLILFSFVGDIIVGVSHSSVFLFLIRLFLNVICIVCFLSFIFGYKKIANVAMVLKRDLGSGELKSLAIPSHLGDESHERKLHLKEILLPWAQLTLISSICGVIMCICCFCLSIFFTVSHVPLWAFWVLHSTIFLMQVVIVITLTIGATLTLTCCTRKNALRQSFMPSLIFKRRNACNGSNIIKRGNVIYQRVALPNGATVLPNQRSAMTVLPLEVTADPEEIVPNNGSVVATEFRTPPPFKHRTNLRRSATFNCAPPLHHPFYGAAPTPQCSTPIYPVLSDHLLPNSNCIVPRTDERDSVDRGRYDRSIMPSGHQVYPAECDLPYRYISRYPSKSYYARDHYSSLRRTHSARRQRPDISAPIFHPDMAGTVEALEIAYQPSNSIAMKPRIQYSLSQQNSFNRSPLSMGTRSPNRIKPDPPEKPVRKVEPILVRGVLKESAVLENSRIVSETTNLQLSTGIGSYSKREVNALESPSYETPLKLNLSPSHSDTHEKHFVYGNNISSPTSLSSDKVWNKKYPDDLTVNPVAHMNGNSKEFYSFSKASNPNLSYGPQSPTRSHKIAMGSRSPALSYRGVHPRNSIHNTSLESASLATPESISLRSSDCEDKPSDNDNVSNRNWHNEEDFQPQDVDNCSDKTLKDESPVSSITNGVSISPPPDEVKRKSLKRNHSTAGDFVPPSKTDDSQSDQSNSDKNNYPWYGTWGGRKNRKRNGIENGRGLANYGSSKRSGSKTSLSSLYGKLRKPGRSKSMYQTDPNKNDDSSMDESEIEDSKSLDVHLDSKRDDVEDELFLPRLTEEIDLESEILKSSTMLANFYSLNRTELKNRRKEREKENEEVTSTFDKQKEAEGNALIYDSYSDNLSFPPTDQQQTYTGDLNFVT